ncbi:MAG: PSD1 domain-containing protein [Fimbriimonadaceae bacterium]|nr:PSD1 domain-containing protein [Fimbriimonadaceae bacterium]
MHERGSPDGYRLVKTLRLRPTVLLALASLWVGIAAQVAGQKPAAKLDFEHDLKPILKARCTPCHFGRRADGGLSLESLESLMAGGASGPAIALSKPNDSLILRRLLGSGGLPRMPMGFQPLPAKELETIQEWIRQGSSKSVGKSPTLHWAFVPPTQAPTPKVKNPKWVLNPIDSFVLDRIEKAGLNPSPEADKVTLIRRLSLDLIGLPPSPHEVDTFIADKSSLAYDRLVDRLLANPHFGERMALPWLDAARYADSNGFQQDGDTYQWVWRDWVVKALNSNMPFDKFTIDQLAGDLLSNPTLDQLIATGFNRNHMLNGEGGAIAEEQRNVNLFDRVDTTSTTWLALTIGCARCHDHNYDPISQRDYYSLMAYFNQVPETGVPEGSGQYRIAPPWVYAGSPEEMEAVHRAEDEASKAKSAVRKFQSSVEFENRVKVWKSRVRAALDSSGFRIEPWFEVGTFAGSSFDDVFAKVFGPEKGSIGNARERKDLQDGKVNPLTGDNRAFYFRRTIHIDHPADCLLSLGSDDGIKVWVNGKEALSRKVTRAALPDSDRVVVQLRSGDNEVLIKIVNGGGVGGFYFASQIGGIDDKTATLLRSGNPDIDALKVAYTTFNPDPAVQKLREGVSTAEAKLTKLRGGLPRVMVMSDKMPRVTHILNRGNYTEPLGEVAPSSPEVLPAANGPRNRLGLANWIVSEGNPLTARVQVNRYWQQLFGHGLVRTEENFGIQGEKPTHPELLDWLAVDFRESGWNVKRLLKLIVTSRTYRQSSVVTPKLLAQDPDNRLLARAPRFRVSSLLLRDLALASSGLLDPKIGGKPVYPYQPKGIWDSLAITEERDFTYPQSKGRENHRRSLYTFWRRTAAPGNMFDASSRQVCTVRQNRTSTPLHALTMLNDVTWVEAGRALAVRLMSIMGDENKLREAFRRVCSRRPNSEELKVLMRSLQRSRQAFQVDIEAAKRYIRLGDIPIDPNTDPVELAALASVCLAIYNLDEAMTRE